MSVISSALGGPTEWVRTVLTRETMRPRLARLGARALFGLLAAGIPYALLFLPHIKEVSPVYESGFQIIVLFVSPFLGPLVFTLLTRNSPQWLHGLVFGVVVGIGAGLLWGFMESSAQQRPGRLTLGLSIAIWMFSFVIAMAGSAFASLIARPITSERRDDRKHRLKPWHLGLAILVLELTLVGAAVAARV